MTLLFVTFALLVLVSVGAMVWGVETQRQDALVVNLAGRQRMLAQQMARLGYEAGEGEDLTNAALQDIEQTFDQTLRALRDGGTAPYLSDADVTLPSTRDIGIRSELNEVNLVWDDARRLLDELQQTPRDDPSFAIILQSVEDKSSMLAAQADEVVRLYEADSIAKVNRLRALQFVFLSSALILLGVGAWITRKSALEPLKELARAANRLGENDLDSAVRVEGPDEMRRLSESFDSMRKSLRSSRSELLELMSTLEERVAQRTRELDALNEVSREIALQLDVKYVLDSVTDKARTLLNSDSAMLCLLGERKQHLHLRAMSGLPALIAFEYVSTINQASEVLTSHQALVCNHGQCVGGCGLLTETRAASHAVAPLRIGEKVIGALCVSSSRKNHFTNESAELLTKLAYTAAIALQNAQLYEQAEKVAALEERNRIAAEMHDGLGQTLSYLGLMTDQVVEFLSKGQEGAALERLHKTRETIGKSTSDVRNAINSLMDETPARKDLCIRLREALEEVASEHNLKADWRLDADSSPECSSQTAELVYNITREALVNAARHARAKQLGVRVGQSDGNYLVNIEDDGRGFDVSQPVPAGHFGLQIMRARAKHIGGNIDVASRPEHGTRVTLTWPKETGD